MFLLVPKIFLEDHPGVIEGVIPGKVRCTFGLRIYHHTKAVSCEKIQKVAPHNRFKKHIPSNYILYDVDDEIDILEDWLYVGTQMPLLLVLRAVATTQ